MAMKDQKAFCTLLKEKYNFKLKGDGPIDYHIGLNYSRNKDGTLVTHPSKYINKMMDYYKRTFGKKPTTYKAPFDKGDHPEVDETELAGKSNTAIYLSMIGQLQWLVALGWFDVFSAVTTMSRFRAAPRKGHLEHLKRMYGYVWDTHKFAIQVRTGEPDYNMFPNQHFDWSYSIYGDVTKEIPMDTPKPLGKPVVLTSYDNANLYHDFVTSCALTAVLHLISQTLFDYYCKQQATVETATFGSKFIAAKTAVDQIIDIRTTL